MKILVAAATEFEIAQLKKHKLTNCTFLITGVGMVQTAFNLGKALSANYDFALQLGIAGSFNRNLNLGDVVNVIEDSFSELGAEDGDTFLTADEIGLKAETIISNNTAYKNEYLDAIPKVTGITVNTVHGNEKTIVAVFNQFHPYTESMEGAAFLLACKQAAIPCAQIRSISNYVERRDKSKWNISLAIDELNKSAIKIINSF